MIQLDPPPADDVTSSILVVDDRAANLLAIRATIEPLGQRVVTAVSGEEALRALLHDDFAVVLLDVRMPNMTGFEVAAAVRNRPRTRATPIIFLTAEAFEAGEMARAYGSGAADFLVKPIDPDVLRAKVAAFVEIHRERERLRRHEQRLREHEAQLREIAENARRETEERLLAVVGSAPVALHAFDHTGRVTLSVGRALETLGLRPGELVGAHASDVFARDPEILANVRRALEGEELTSHDRVNGNDVWWETSWAPIRSPAGDLAGAIAVAMDVSDRVRLDHEREASLERERAARTALEQERVQLETAKRDLQEAVVARDQFISIASHELRTPLTGIGLRLDQLAKTLSQHSADTREMRQMAGLRRGVDRLDKLVGALLDVARAHGGKLEVQCAQMDLATLARDVAARFADEGERVGSSITVDAPGTLEGEWDRERLDQVLTNLLSNAIKYGGGTPIRVIVTSNETRARITVRDRGPGIAAKDQARIFRRFERVEAARTIGGLGLGLWIASQIVAAMRGEIAVESKAGEGATFSVDLPLRARAVAPGSLSPPASETARPPAR